MSIFPRKFTDFVILELEIERIPGGTKRSRDWSRGFVGKRVLNLRDGENRIDPYIFDRI